MNGMTVHCVPTGTELTDGGGEVHTVDDEHAVVCGNDMYVTEAMYEHLLAASPPPHRERRSERR